jgi:diguanylate cyclase (GGDEF)-like protein/PAS domain S-box-containing protein
MQDDEYLESVSIKPDEKTLEFANKLSDPVLLVNISGEVFAKNEVFIKGSNNLSLNQLSLTELTNLVVKSFAYKKFPLPQDAPIGCSTIVDSLDRRHTLYLYPYIFPGTHAVILQDYTIEDILQRVLDCIPSKVFWKDRSGKYLGANHLFLADCGLTSSEQLVGFTDYDFFSARESDHFVADDEQVMSSGEPKLNIEEPQTRLDGKVNWLQTSKVPIRNQNKEVIGVMGSYTDITERKIYQELIEGQALRDQLTNLHNRQSLQEFFDRLEQDDKCRYGGLLFIDLDNFKTVNDTLGHAVGDELLRMVAGRIKTVASDGGFVVRLGGDEFAVLLMSEKDGEEELLLEETNQLAINIRQAILEPYLLDSHDIQLGVSIGVTYFYSGNTNWVDTFNEADLAMYYAKASDKNTIKVFCEDMRTKHTRINQMQAMLKRAIENSEFYLNIQPQYNAEKKIIGGEVLLRWDSKELGLVPPVEFIPLAEQSGSIHSIGMWVFEKAFSLVYEWSEKYGAENVLPIAVNLSAKQFQRSDFLEGVEKLLKKFPIKNGLIYFELTESLLVESEMDAIEKLKGLSKLGFPLAIDDFGTGYSCLGYLNQLPIDKIKIDKSFTFQINEDSCQASLVGTIISMAKNLNMKVIAEGVETKAQMQYLLQHGCFEFQGFYFSKPVNVQEYQNLLELQMNNVTVC